jgi:general stress protein 26
VLAVKTQDHPMPSKTLADLSKEMQDLDFAILFTKASNGTLAGRPMSNNGDTEYDGDSFFFTDGSTDMVDEIRQDANVSLSFAGAKSLLGKPGIFIVVRGKAELIQDKAAFESHWVKDLDRWFPQGVDTPGLTLIKVHASHVHYWDGEDEGVIHV